MMSKFIESEPELLLLLILTTMLLFQFYQIPRIITMRPSYTRMQAQLIS